MLHIIGGIVLVWLTSGIFISLIRLRSKYEYVDMLPADEFVALWLFWPIIFTIFVAKSGYKYIKKAIKE